MTDPLNAVKPDATGHITIPHYALRSALSGLMMLNRAIHATCAQPSMTNSEHYVRDFGTLIVQSGMRTGKSYVADQYAMEPHVYRIAPNAPDELLSSLDNMRSLRGISIVMIDCWLQHLLSFQNDQSVLAKMNDPYCGVKGGFTSIIDYIAYRVQQKFGPDTMLIILG